VTVECRNTKHFYIYETRCTRYEQVGNRTRSAGSEQVHSTHCLNKKQSDLDVWVTFVEEPTFRSKVKYMMGPAPLAMNSGVPLFKLWLPRLDVHPIFKDFKICPESCLKHNELT